MKLRKSTQLLLLFFHLFFFQKSNAENIDSLWSIFKDYKYHDTIRLEAFSSIAWNMLYKDPEKAYLMGHRELEMARTKKLQKQEAQALNVIGASYHVRGNFLKAIEFYQQSLALREKIGDKKGASASSANIGGIYIDIGESQKALEYEQKSLKIFEELHDDPGKASTLNNMSVIYNELHDFHKALNFAEQGLELYLKLDDKPGIQATYDNIGISYSGLLDYTKAIEFQLKCLELSKIFGDKFNASNSMTNIGRSYLKQKKYTLALDYLNRSKSIAIESKNIKGQTDVMNALYETYKALGDNAKALKCYELSIELKDSISKEETQREINNKELQYAYEKKAASDSVKNEEEQKVKDALIFAKNAQIEQDKTQKWALFGGVFLLLAFGAFMFSRFRITRRQKEIIEIKNNETELQKGIIETKQKEILSSISYAKRIQEAILPAHGFLQRYLPDSFFFYKPKDIVAGDFYWFESFNHSDRNTANLNSDSVSETDGLILFAAADCTGHGVPGAMVSVVCSNALNRTLKEFRITEPGKILEKTRELVIETFEKSASEVIDGMDISLCCLDKKNKMLQWSGANSPLWIIRNKECIEYKPLKQFIGKVDKPLPFITHTIDLKENDILYLFSDGFADQFGGVGNKKFKRSRMKELFLSVQNLPMQEQLIQVEQTLNKWQGKNEQVDDILLIGIRV